MDAIDRLTISRLTRFHRRWPHSIYVPKAVLPLVTTAHQLLEPRVERDQSENATGLSGLRLTDNEKMSGRA